MIDEIFDKLWDDYAKALSDDGAPDYNAAAKTAIYEIGLAVIGEDVEVAGIKDLEDKVYIVPAQNQLRASQRKAWAKACGVAEK